MLRWITDQVTESDFIMKSPVETTGTEMQALRQLCICETGTRLKLSQRMMIP